MIRRLLFGLWSSGSSEVLRRGKHRNSLAASFASLAALASGFLTVAINQPVQGRDYYIANGGNDTGGGTASAPWRTLGKVNSVVFKGGDRIFFKRGDSWTGQLRLRRSGTADNGRIVVSAYGAGNKPQFNNSDPDDDSTIKIANSSGWVLEDLSISKRNGAGERAGVLILNNVSGSTQRDYVLRNLTITEVVPDSNLGHGILVVADRVASGSRPRINKVLIEGCDISNTTRYGAWIVQTPFDRDNPVRNSDITVRNNKFEETGGTALLTSFCADVDVNNNRCIKSGAYPNSRYWGRGSGYWPIFCNNVKVTRNRFEGAKGWEDSFGMHVDFGNRNVLVENNLSIDNQGGFIQILGDNNNVVYRYNISINDGYRTRDEFTHGRKNTSASHVMRIIGYVGRKNRDDDPDLEALPPIPSTNVYVYNNTAYTRAGLDENKILVVSGTEGVIANNIFCLLGKTTAGFDTKGVGIEAPREINVTNNAWFGDIEASIFKGSNTITTGGAGFTRIGGLNAADYKLVPSSQLRNKGTSNSAWTGPFPRSREDYFGVTLSNPLSIGASEQNAP